MGPGAVAGTEDFAGEPAAGAGVCGAVAGVAAEGGVPVGAGATDDGELAGEAAGAGVSTAALPEGAAGAGTEGLCDAGLAKDGGASGSGARVITQTKAISPTRMITNRPVFEGRAAGREGAVGAGSRRDEERWEVGPGGSSAPVFIDAGTCEAATEVGGEEATGKSSERLA